MGLNPPMLGAKTRTVMRLLLALLLTGAVSCSAQEVITAQSFNGRAWETWTAVSKLAYVSASRMDCACMHPFQGCPQYAATKNDYVVEKFTTIDVAREIDQGYKDRENIRVPVFLVFDYVVQKLKGRTTKADLEKRLMALRKAAAEF